MEKICFKCPERGMQPLTNYYKHAQMGDGHLNKCKDCTKKDVSERYDVKILEPEFLESERTRGRDKYRRLYVGTGKANSGSNNRWLDKYPEKAAAIKSNARMEVPVGFEAHHWSYKEEHRHDVIGLRKKGHMKGHRFIQYDQSEMMYRRKDTNELLDTKEKHRQYITWCIMNKEN